jgi:hypothetical protein
MRSFEDSRRKDSGDTRWQVTTPTGLRYVCRVWVVGSRIEVRLTTEQDALVCSRVVTSFDVARDIARSWLRSIVDTGGTTEVDPGPRADVTH